MHPDDRAKTVETISDIDNQEKTVTFKNRYRCKNDMYRLFEWRSRVKGSLIYAVARDITDQKRADEEAQSAELRYRNFFENVQETFYETSIDGNILDVSPSVKNLSKGQYKPEDLVGKPLSDLYADYRERDVFLETLLKNDIVTDYEIKLKNLDGSIIECSISSKLLRDTSGNPLKIIGSLVDISKRKQVEKELYESEFRFKALHNASFGGIVIHDKGIIIDCNQGLCDMTGYTYDELIDTNGLRLIAPESLEEVKQKMLSNAEEPYEVKGIRKDGTIYPLYLQSKLIPYKGRTVRVGEFRDITELKQAEEERLKLESQLRQSQKIESVGQLAGGVAHDFNNMLSAILGHAELAMMRCSPSEPVLSHLKGIEEAATRSTTLVSQLLAFARKQTIAPMVLNINDMSSNILKMLRRLIGEDIDLAWSPGLDLWKVKMDPSQVDQILVNLCVNARDAITGVGKITIETKNTTIDQAYSKIHIDFVPGDFIMLAISDNGSGMSKEVQEHIYEPFYSTKELSKGTGLGLATVYGIVKQNGGFINLYSEINEGTTFKIYLPRFIGEDAVHTAEIATVAPEGNGETILLVEDESVLREVAQTMLKELGYVVLIASTPGEAINIAKNYTSEIHLLITDVIMPEMNGRDLSKLICHIRPDIKCIFTSGYTANVIAHHGVLDEDVWFLPKPFSMNDLSLKIHQILEEG